MAIVLKARYCCDFRDCFFAAYEVYVVTDGSPKGKDNILFESYGTRVRTTKKCREPKDIQSVEELRHDPQFE